MSHERSTPTSPPSAPPFSTSSSAFIDHNIPLTTIEDFCVKRSRSSFNAIAGAAGGFTSAIVSCPLDVIKTKLQAQGGFRARQAKANLGHVVYSGVLGTGRVIWREDGLKGMYRGLGPLMLGYIPTWAVMFTVYGKAKDHFSKTQTNENFANVYSSVIAGCCSTMLTNPIWVIKTRLMSQVSRKATNNEARPPWHYRSTFDAAKKMYKTEGILSFYSGLTPALLGLTHVAVQFPAYEFLKKKFTGQGMGQGSRDDTSSHWFGTLSATVLSKIVASSATYPHEVIRTRLQTQQRSSPAATSKFATFKGGMTALEQGQILEATKTALPRYRGIVTTFRTILREEGWRAFYAGMGVNMVRTVPAATTYMLTYEFIMKELRETREEGLRKQEAAGW